MCVRKQSVGGNDFSRRRGHGSLTNKVFNKALSLRVGGFRESLHAGCKSDSLSHSLAMYVGMFSAQLERSRRLRKLPGVVTFAVRESVRLP
eukprot:6791116-Pyramimonas_sp.AAC.1